MTRSLVGFLEDSDGAVEILATIEVSGTRYGELVSKVGVSHDTVANRLNEAEDLGLVRRKAVAGERGTTHKWALTGKGARIRMEMESLGIVKHYRLIQMYRQRVRESKVELYDRVEELEHEMDLDDELENEMALERWRRAVESRNPDDDAAGE